MIAPTTRLWSIQEYYLMVETGILAPDERVELLAGEIISMAAKKPPHVVVTKLAADYLEQLLDGLALVRSQDPVHLNQYSEPEPDIALVMPPVRRYLEHHPTPEEIFLLIEVADSTLKFDTNKKARLYAESNVADYWVIDALTRQVYVFRKPVAGIYTQNKVLDDNSTTTLLAFPSIEVKLIEFFP